MLMKRQYNASVFLNIHTLSMYIQQKSNISEHLKNCKLSTKQEKSELKFKSNNKIILSI